MPGTSDMNIIIGQGDSIKEVYNIRKQNLELNQPYIAQQMESKRKEEKAKVKEPPREDRIEVKHEKEESRKFKENSEKKDKNEKEDKQDTDEEERLIDIRI